MRSFLSLASLVLVVGSVGCDADDPPDLEEYFAAQPYGEAACDAVDDRLAGAREMRLYVNSGSVLPVTQGLASYYHRHSLSFFTAAQPARTTMAYAIDTNETRLLRELRAEFPGVDLSDEAALMAADPVLYAEIVTYAGNLVLKPIIDFAETHSDRGADATNLIVVPQMESTDGEHVTDPGTSLAGLAISPALLAEFDRTQPEDAEIWRGIRLPANFTPMMVLGNDILKRARALDPVLDDLITAHEFGHTGALVHTTGERNLMYPGVTPGLNDCSDSLDDTQLATMSASYGLGPSANAALLANSTREDRSLSEASKDSRPAASRAAGASRLRARFAPDRLRAMLAGDRGAMRSFVELLFHGAAH